MSTQALLLYLTVPAGLCMVAYHARVVALKSRVRSLLVAMSASLGLSVSAAAMYALMNPHYFNPWITDMLAVARASLVPLGLGFCILAVVLICRRRWVLQGLAAALVILWTGFGMLVVPALGCNGIDRGSALNTVLHCPGTDLSASGVPASGPGSETGDRTSR